MNDIAPLAPQPSPPSPPQPFQPVQPAPPPVPQPPKRRFWTGFREIFSTVGLLLLAPIAAIIFTAFVFQFYKVDGPSMEDTLQNNDRLIVYKLPRTFARLFNKTYLPKRGEIVVFNRNEAAGNGKNEPRQLIKRVIGLPGDRVLVRSGEATIINDEHPGGFDPDANTQYEETMPATLGNVDVTLDDDEIFVMGDNRTNSLDSRVFGPITSEQIVGRLLLRVAPFESFPADSPEPS